MTSGTEESITHALMITEMAPAVLAAFFLEINAGVLALIIGSYLAHEGDGGVGHLLPHFIFARLGSACGGITY